MSFPWARLTGPARRTGGSATGSLASPRPARYLEGDSSQGLWLPSEARSLEAMSNSSQTGRPGLSTDGNDS